MANGRPGEVTGRLRPLAPDRSVLLGAYSARGSPGRPTAPGVTSPPTTSGAPVGVTSGRPGCHRLPATHVTPSGFPIREDGPDAIVDSGAPMEQCCRSGSGQVGRAAPVRPPPKGPQDRLQCPAEAGQVPVVDAAVVQLTGELTEQPRPVPAGRLAWYMDFDPPLDHLHSRPAGGRRAALFPGSMSAGGRAPLRDRAAAAWGDRSAAPSAGRRGGASFRPGRHGGGPVRTGTFYSGGLPLLSALLLACPPSSPVLGSAAGAHALSVQALLQ